MTVVAANRLPLSTDTLLRRLTAAGVLAVVTVQDAGDAANLGRSLREGGVVAVELALRTPASLEALRRLRQAEPHLLLGAGTVLTPAQAHEAKAAGADFALAPGLDEATVRECAAIDLPFIPGVATASEIQRALSLGCVLLKWFPAESLGGTRGLRALSAPFLHLGVRFVPLGGIDASTLPLWLREPTVAAVGGSWIATSDLIRSQTWSAITQNAAAAVRIAREAKEKIS